MATITIPDDVFQKLNAKAAARKLSLDAYLNDVAAEGMTGTSSSGRQLAALESFIAGMTEWTAAHLPPGHVTDDGRERIYEGRPQ